MADSISESLKKGVVLDQEQIAGAFNALIEERDLIAAFDRGDFFEISFPQEIRAARRSFGDDEGRRRFNRILLEAIFPNALAKMTKPDEALRNALNRIRRDRLKIEHQYHEQEVRSNWHQFIQQLIVSDPFRMHLLDNAPPKVIPNKDGGWIMDLVEVISLLRQLGKISDETVEEPASRVFSNDIRGTLVPRTWPSEPNSDPIGLSDISTRPLVLADLYFGILGYPNHANIQRHKRWRYTADEKHRQMFLDVFVFDQVRYVYDWLPSLRFLKNFLTEGDVGFFRQVVIRSCLKQMRRHLGGIDSDLFAGLRTDPILGAKLEEYPLPPRIEIEDP